MSDGSVENIDSQATGAVDIGDRLRRFRQLMGLTQRALANRSGVNHSTISLIEQNRISPSVGLLKRLLDGIPVSLSRFFAEEEAAELEKFHFAASELVELADGPIRLRQVGKNLAGRALQIMHERYEPGADTGPLMLRHEGEEGGIVTRGELELTVSDVSRILVVGDAYYFNSRLPHRFRNPSQDVTEVISVCTPPTF